MGTARDICLACDLARCAGACVCSVDGAPIERHAATGCPMGRFAGDGLSPPAEIPEGFDVEEERRRLKAGGCCGAPAATDLPAY